MTNEADRLLAQMFGEDLLTQTRARIDQQREAAKELILLAYSAERETNPLERIAAAVPLAMKAKDFLGTNASETAFEAFFSVVKCAGELAVELRRTNDELAETRAALTAAREAQA